MLRSDSARKCAINLSLNVKRLDGDRAAIDAYGVRVKKVGMWNRSLHISRGSI